MCTIECAGSSRRNLSTHFSWVQLLTLHCECDPHLLCLMLPRRATHAICASSRFARNLAAGCGRLNDIGVGLLTQGDDGVIAVSVFNLVRGTASSSSRRGRSPWALEVILFAVRKSFEGQGVAQRLEVELFEFCSAFGDGSQPIDKMIILNAKRQDDERNCEWDPRSRSLKSSGLRPLLPAAIPPHCLLLSQKSAGRSLPCRRVARKR